MTVIKYLDKWTFSNIKKSIRPVLTIIIIWMFSSSMMGLENQMFDAKMDGDQLYFTFSESSLGKPYLFVMHEYGYKIVYWKKQDTNILLETFPIETQSGNLIPIDGDSRIKRQIMGKFPYTSDNQKSEYTINVTDFLLKANYNWPQRIPEIVLMGQSLVESVHYLDKEIVINTQRNVQSKVIYETLQTIYSFYVLPEKMKSRRYDQRIGFMPDDFTLMPTSLYKENLAAIKRWRLEKKDANEGKSNPIKPIIFYLDQNIPDQWKPYVKAGVLDWQATFEKAGFENAIEVREMPEDYKKIANSVNISMIRWTNNNKIRGSEERTGSTIDDIVDPRTGEILKADIILGTSFQHLMDSYIVRCSPLDSRAQQYPLPHDLIGRLIQSLTSHEAGHAFGLMDGNYGEYAYPVEKVRKAGWLKKMGHTPSIMSYARHNNVAQVEDSVPPNLLIQKVGPMDYYSINLAYRQLPDSIDEEKFLTSEIFKQDSINWFRYVKFYNETIGPQYINEVVESSNPIISSELAINNLKKVSGLLPAITRNQNNMGTLERLDEKLLEQWYNQIKYVLSLVGGFTVQSKAGNQEGPVFTPVDLDKQFQAIKFFIENSIYTPEWLSSPRYESKLRYSTKSDKLLQYQLRLLYDLLNIKRMKRIEMSGELLGKPLLFRDILDMLSKGIFENDSLPHIEIRRLYEMQITYINILKQTMAQENLYNISIIDSEYYILSELNKSIILNNLKEIRKKLFGWIQDSQTIDTAHFEQCVNQINDLIEVN